MTDHDMGRYLASLAKAIPVPPPNFSRLRERILHQEETRCSRQRRHPVRRAVIACLAAGLVTLTAAVGYSAHQRYLASQYGAYVYNTTNTAICREFGVKLPLHLADYTLISNDISLLADHSTGRESALFRHVYRVGGATYQADAQAEDCLEVSVGSTGQPYWATYFSYDIETLEWLPEEVEQHGFACENVETIFYGGHEIYLYDLWSDGALIAYTAVWLDEARGVCWHVSDALSRDHLLTCVKSLIDCNK
jgi:hypothetical protein